MPPSYLLIFWISGDNALCDTTIHGYTHVFSNGPHSPIDIASWSPFETLGSRATQKTRRARRVPSRWRL
jgi:hypothetical protein